jgi:hypothetical protein
MKGVVRVILLGLTGLAVLASAGDQAPSQPPPAPATPGATAAPALAPAGDIEDFVPSEKVSADDAVAFPVDI